MQRNRGNATPAGISIRAAAPWHNAACYAREPLTKTGKNAQPLITKPYYDAQPAKALTTLRLTKYALWPRSDGKQPRN